MAPKILILCSNPRRDLNLEREVGDLIKAVQRLGNFEVRIALAVGADDLQELFLEHKPRIVHFCGHGAGEQGLVLQDRNGREQVASTAALSGLFKIFSNHVDCAVFNACDSAHQAEAVVAYINYAIGMSEEIFDKAAYIFAVGFYQGLGYGESIERAYELGCNAIQLQFLKASTTHSDQSRSYRKAELVAPIIAQPVLPEHLKPVLRRKSQSHIPSVESAAEAMRTSASLTPTTLPPGFVETVEQEVDRKEYKDQARAAYDNFGQFSASGAADHLAKSEYKQRKILVDKVREFWIEGFLRPSLLGVNAIQLDLQARPDAIADLSQGIETLSVELDESFEELRETQIYEEMGQGRTLLILGEPGAGKTIALLQLAQRLIERTEQKLSLPIPVVFNLSSWAKDRKSIVDWLIDELREKYQVPKSLSELWIRNQQLILLLDGLDEVNAEYRNDCVRDLNEFIGLFPQTEIAVCSRIKDYEALTERLQISSALCLQPFSTKQVYQFLDNVGGSLAGLRALLKRDSDLERFAQTPLILNLMSAAYQGWSVEQLTQEDLQFTANRNQNLFDTYVGRQLKRGATSEYSKDQVLHWLSWLANRMAQEKQTIFLIEKLQPTWLQSRQEERAYRAKAFIFSGLTAGSIIGLTTGLFSGRIYSLSYGFLLDNIGVGVGLVLGLLGGLVVGIITGLQKTIFPLGQLSWSWQRARSKFIRDFLSGAGLGLLLWLLFEMAGAGIVFREFNWQISVLTGGLLFGLSSGLSNFEIEQSVVPNQGIRNSLKNCFFIGLVSALLVGLFIGLVAGLKFRLMDEVIYETSNWTIFGLFVGLLAGHISGLLVGLRYGGLACLQHFILRQVLYEKGHIPWNYAKFLDFVSDRLLMKRIGGGYVFFHRMLMEHFASKYSD